MREAGNGSYHLKTISSRGEIETCERADICEAAWPDAMQADCCPEAWAYMGYLTGEGLLVRLVCRERNPKITYVNHKESVWKDSALEVFLAFSRSADGSAGVLTNDSLYLNFEINAGGAMYAQWGYGRKGRSFVPERVYEESGCKAEIFPDHWQAELLIPEWYLREIGGWEYGSASTEISTEHLPEIPAGQQAGVKLYCNFYKISESPEIEHYLSFRRIENETPNFHLPVFFAEVISEK